MFEKRSEINRLAVVLNGFQWDPFGNPFIILENIVFSFVVVKNVYMELPTVFF